MRGTLHFAAAADVRWMVELLGPRVVAGAAGRFRALGLDNATLGRARRVLTKRLEGEGWLSRPAVYEALERANIPTAGQRGLHILWRLAHDGLLCFGPRDGKKQTLVLFDAWLPGAKRLRREEALAELAHRYFTGHGPATVADFAWWSGLKLADARLAVQLAGPALHQEILRGRPHWFAQSGAPVPARRSNAFLLPAFDEFVVAYADRSAALAPSLVRRVNTSGGILNPTVVIDGRVVGTWKRRLARGEVLCSLTPFTALSEARTTRGARCGSVATESFWVWRVDSTRREWRPRKSALPLLRWSPHEPSDLCQDAESRS